jgi:proteasome lid subunit RPN8/RPN11
VIGSETGARPSNIVISDTVLMGLEKHAYSNLRAEVGGMLFGKVDDSGKAVINGSIPALTAAADQISLTFTHDVWADILSKGEVQFPGQAIVGWYHTHPSFGLFMSEYDEFIQRNFFSKKGQIALVIDPIAGEMGWFQRSELDKIALIYKERTKLGPKPTNQMEVKPKNSLRNTILTHGAVAVVSAALSFGISFATRGPDLEQSQRNLVENYNSLNGTYNSLKGYLQGPNFIYTVTEGDTYASISTLFYGDAKKEVQLRADNGEKEPEVGSQMFIRGPVRFFVADPGYAPKPANTVSPTPSRSPTPSVSPTPDPSPSPETTSGTTP